MIERLGSLVRVKGLHRWLGTYLKTRHLRRDYSPGEPLELILCICDHFEPKRGNASPQQARGRVQEWIDNYPRLFDRFRDVDGVPPQHTFFYPQDEYEPELVELTAQLCRAGYGEVEVHLHHDHDTPDGLRRKLLDFKKRLHEEHGLLGKDRRTGEVVYGFIHGNWALDNSRQDGRWCGVNNEIDILRETGCYADFTMPSAPDETQTSTINQLYWATDDPQRPKSHDRGVQLGQPQPANSLLMVQGPLLLDWEKRKFGLFPSIENGNLQFSQPPSSRRLALWMRSRIGPHPTKVFVKLHTHGLHEPNQKVLLGESMVELHELLAARFSEGINFSYRYVTAREFVNLALNTASSVEKVLDIGREYCYLRPEGLSQRSR